MRASSQLFLDHLFDSLYWTFFAVSNESIVFSTVDDEKGEKLDEIFGLKPSLLKVQPSGCLLPPKIVFYAQKIRDMPVYEDDVWMISFPRTGECFSNAILTNSK